MYRADLEQVESVPDTTPHSRLSVAVIGAGFGGIGMAVRLRAAGVANFAIFDRADGVGGTWWTNRYPGCACDVPSQLYSFSFQPNPDWTRRFAPRAEIQRYLERVVERHDLTGRLRLGVGIERMAWNDEARHWRLVDDQGRIIEAEFVVSAIGGLSRPAWPDIAGIQDFSGPVMHSQQWRDDVPLDDRRVAVIGTGASAAQLAPEIAARVERLDVYQRTPHWILPRPDAAIPPYLRRLYRRFPLAQKMARFRTWLISEARVPGLLWSNRLAVFHRMLADWHRRRQVRDPDMRARLRPDFAIGCKRVILSNDWYPTLDRVNVDLVATPIDRIGADHIVLRDGKRRATDVIVLATGFQATDPVPEGMISGRDGCDLATAWRNGPEAWKGVAVHGFPNLFLMMGPNTALGHSSVVLMLEAQAGFIARAIAASGGRALEPCPNAQARYNTWLRRRLAVSVWNSGGCASWYLHPRSGQNTTLWPGSTWGYRRMMNKSDPAALARAADRI